MSLKDKLPEGVEEGDELYAVVSGEVTSEEQVTEDGLELPVKSFHTTMDEAVGQVDQYNKVEMVVPVSPDYILD